jgi:DMSO/TMAO reductase YedYZ molybdopterin-dependent catalytic subunit
MGSITRRALIKSGLAAAAGVGGMAAAAGLAERYRLIPPDYRTLYGIGQTLTYASHRIVTPTASLAREFTRRDISPVAPVNGPAPESDPYLELLEDDFGKWRLAIEGLVARPSSFSLAELKRLPTRSQITMHTCEEGWSFIAEWTGVLLSDVLTITGVDSRARYVVFIPYDQWWDSLELQEALHPQTLLAWGMNGENLSLDHGAPVRLRVPKQMGYKSIKFLSRIRVVDTLADVGQGLGSASAEAGYAWYAGI